MERSSMGTKLCLSSHASLLASGLLHQTIPDILLASQNGDFVETNRILLASSSNIFAHILASQPSADCIILPDIPFRQVQLMLEMLQSGQVLAQSQEARDTIDLAKQLQVPGTFSLVKEERVEDACEGQEGDEEMEDDVFDYDATQHDYTINNNDALDLSPATRYNVKSTDHKHFSFEFQAKDLSCSSSIPRTAAPGAPPPRPPPGAPPPPHNLGSPSSAATKSLQRSRKPPPLKYLQSAAVDCQPPVQTPWTPLAASPVIEESFKKIVQQQNAKETGNEEKLRNLSVSSADFEHSLPNTPSHNTKDETKSEKFCHLKTVGRKAEKFASRKKEVMSADIKIEPSDTQQSPSDMDLEQPNLSIDDRSRTPSPPPPTLPPTKLEQTTTATTSQDSIISEPISADKAKPTPVAPLPEILLPALAKTLSPIQQILIFHQHEMLQRGREGNSNVAAGGCDVNSSKSSGSGSSSSSKSGCGDNLLPLPLPRPLQQPSTSLEHQHQQILSAAAARNFSTTAKHTVSNRLEAAKLRQKQLKLKAKEGAGGGGSGAGSQQEEGRFKCERCGKSYNWNYNLNRHMRFECGIGNRFQCGVCKRRFPHKQNAAIHLKRKHLLQLESAEEMLASGHIIILSNLPKKSS
eukprot:TRINITY_DN8781_c0_g1_i5.p1 TRINITY_DN8781_c0_g1~~TRINITY_DN8781_c0_g1_i5.p1  ORF type:complete len:635 (+),score=153.52 TRINITY_DN8781_c0_g1_i5:65-1969(+)